MGNYFKTIYLFASTQLKRSLRDPLTVVILMGLPVMLLLVFGAFLNNTTNLTLRTAIVNQSEHTFAEEFEKSLRDSEIIEATEDELTLDEARDRMQNSELDTIIELSETFGVPTEEGMPTGAVKYYVDDANAQSSQLVGSVVNAIVDGYNDSMIDVTMPLVAEPISINVNEVQPISWVYAMFTGMAILMVGIFGVGSLLPADKKAKILRRMHVTPLKPSQVSIGTMLAFAAIGIVMVLIMTALAMLLFDMEIKGNYLTLAIFVAIGLVGMLGFGLAIGGVAKNSTQADVAGQIIFLGSLALGGVWFPIAMLPEYLQAIVNFMPLTPIIEGLRYIITDGATLIDLGPQLLVMGIWILIVYIVGFRTFRWE